MNFTIFWVSINSNPNFFAKISALRYSPSRSGVVARYAVVYACLDFVENGVYVEVEIESGHDVLEAFSYNLERLRAVALFRLFVEARVKCVRHFDVGFVAFPGCGNDDIFSLRIAFYDVYHAGNGFAVRHRSAAEFANFHIESLYYVMRRIFR